jgi:hypothetical protein
MDQRLQIV